MSWVGRVWNAMTGKAPEGKRLYYTGATLYGGGGAWLGMLRAKDQEVRADMAAMRSNSRRLLNNNPFMKRYIRTLGNHVVGPKGMKLQSLFRTSGGERRDPYAGKIEVEWGLWSKKGTPSVRLSNSLPSSALNHGSPVCTLVQAIRCFSLKSKSSGISRINSTPSSSIYSAALAWSLGR